MKTRVMRRSSIVAVLAAVAVVVVLGVLVFGLLQPGSAFAQGDNGRTVNARVGDTMRVELHENPTTGYMWHASVSAGLEITASDYAPDDKTGMLVGSGGTRAWTIRVSAAGTQRFAAALQPPDPAKAPVSPFSLLVDAR